MTKPRRSWFVGHTAALLAFAGFVGLSLWAKWNPVQGQEGPKQVRKAEKKTEAKETKKAPKSPSTTAHPVPGAGKKLDSLALAKLIDDEIARGLKEGEVKPSPRSSDTEFLRRVYLDLIGVIPPVEKVEAFLADKDTNKRAKVIDELLTNERFGKYHAEVWSGLMLPRDSNNRALNRTPMQKWLAGKFNENTPLDKLVYQLVTATGSIEENGASTYFVGNATVDKMTDNVTRMFLGVQLQCAQCHNHPFTEWKQNEYWAMAAFFMKVRISANPQQAAKKGVAPEVTESSMAKAGKKGLPESAKIVPAKFLQGASPKLATNEPYRPVLATWMTAKDNPFFARAMVNRWWHQLFARGLVNPVDDMHDENQPTHPELLAALTEQFKNNDFDLRYLLKAICNSDTYQRSSVPVGDNKTDRDLYSHRLVRVLCPEQLVDSLTTVLGNTPNKKEDPTNRAIAKKGGNVGPRENFLAFFRIEEGFDPLDYQAGIPQALRLMNSAQINNTNAAVTKAMQQGKNEPEQVLKHLVLQALSRPATDQEIQRFLKHVRSQTDPRAGYGDILWALVNSSEFALNH